MQHPIASWSMAYTLFALLFATFAPCCRGDGVKDAPSLAAVRVERGDEIGVQSTFLEPVELHEVPVATLDPEPPRVVSSPKTPRHVHEKTNLLDRLRRDKGSWSSNHPRHRLLDALYGFTKYQQRHKEELERLKGLYSKVTKQQHKILEKYVGYSNKFIQIEKLLEKNQHLCDRITDNALEFYEISRSELDKHISHLEADGKKADKIAVSQSLKHFVRDWTSSGGDYERDACFSCLIKTLDSLFPDRSGSRDSAVKVLLPGAGLGRLGSDIAEKGEFQVTINEWSMYMNVAYRFLETHGHRPDSEFFHPFVESWSHHASMDDMTRPMSFPDKAFNASQVLMVEGDFTTVFNTKPRPQYDVIITYFFIDTARNLVSYLETIKALLAPGGYWINLGPLLYGSAPFVQLPLEDVLNLAEDGLGFTLLDVGGSECGETTLSGRFVRSIEAAYGFDKLALTKNAFDAQFWVAQRP